MQVLLLKDVEGLGRAGDIKNVAAGHAQNYLLPRKLAIAATEGALKQDKQIKEAAERQRDRKQTEAKALAARINGKVVTFVARAGENDRLYGSITGHDIAERLAAAVGIEIDHHLIMLEHPIKSLGEHEVPVRVASGAVATITVRVDRAQEE